MCGGGREGGRRWDGNRESLCLRACRSAEGSAKVSSFSPRSSVLVFFFLSSVFFSPTPKVWFRERQEAGAARDLGRRPGQAPSVCPVNSGECPRSGARRRRGLRSGAALLSPPRAGEAGSRGRAGGSPACARPALPWPPAWTAALGRRPPRHPPGKQSSGRERGRPRLRRDSGREPGPCAELGELR